MFDIGDVVVCVNSSPSSDWIDVPGYVESVRVLHLGATYRVAAVKWWDGWVDGLGCVVSLVGVPDAAPDLECPECPRGWGAHRFRKIRPADDEFIALMAECKPVRIEA